MGRLENILGGYGAILSGFKINGMQEIDSAMPLRCLGGLWLSSPAQRTPITVTQLTDFLVMVAE